MLAPFVLPEALVIPVGVFPVYFHVVEQSGLAISLQGGGDAGVLAGCVAEGLVGAVAVVGPGEQVSFIQGWAPSQ